MSPEEELRARPSFEQAGREYVTMLDEMRADLSRVAPGLVWKTPGSAQKGSSLCGKPFSDIDGVQSAAYDSGDATGPIPDAAWPAAVDALKAVGQRYGFVTVTPIVDVPGRHEVAVHDGRGASVELGTQKNTTLVVLGACFLTEKAKGTTTPG